jgi:hypothetical protein
MRCSKLLATVGFFAALLLLHSCLGTNAKTLGKKSVTGITPADADSFSVTIAYREDANPLDGRNVQLQSIRGLAAANLVNSCGAKGTACTCDFYRKNADGSVDPAFVTATTVGISKDNNSFSCTIPGVESPDNFVLVRLRTTDSLKTTGFIDIKTTLTLQDVIGDLSVNKVNKIYKYSCSRTFFEGEGVSTTEIVCQNSQKLGLISATYDYYLYQSKLAGNMSDKFSDAYWGAVCSRPNAEFARFSCGTSIPDLRYALYAEPVAPFLVKIEMTKAPEGTDLKVPYGYAALPDTSGTCPTGLVAIRPWLAEPASITAGTIDGLNPPSNFLNIGAGSLNNIVIETSAPANFVVNRQSNANPCAPVGGSCAAATFNLMTPVQSVSYSGLTPVVCAIPKSLVLTL